jgi:hypothetical protein
MAGALEPSPPRDPARGGVDHRRRGRTAGKGLSNSTESSTERSDTTRHPMEPTGTRTEHCGPLTCTNAVQPTSSDTKRHAPGLIHNAQNFSQAIGTTAPDRYGVLAARGLLASSQRGERKPRASAHAYPLRGLLFCSICGRRMEGAFRSNRNSSDGRILYRCVIKQNRAVSVLPEHPSSLYVREDAILGPLDDWIASMTSAQALESHQPPAGQSPAVAELEPQLRDLDRRIEALVTAIEVSADVPQLAEQLKRRVAQRDGLAARLRSQPQQPRLSAAQLAEAMTQLGGMPNILASADPVKRQQVYTSLGLRLVFDSQTRQIHGTASEACVFNRVRRGT